MLGWPSGVLGPWGGRHHGGTSLGGARGPAAASGAGDKAVTAGKFLLVLTVLQLVHLYSEDENTLHRVGVRMRMGDRLLQESFEQHGSGEKTVTGAPAAEAPGSDRPVVGTEGGVQRSGAGWVVCGNKHTPDLGGLDTCLPLSPSAAWRGAQAGRVVTVGRWVIIAVGGEGWGVTCGLVGASSGSGPCTLPTPNWSK